MSDPISKIKVERNLERKATNSHFWTPQSPFLRVHMLAQTTESLSLRAQTCFGSKRTVSKFLILWIEQVIARLLEIRFE